ncbi:hypothetical protein O6H91_19G034700 [Diphasiastrum complanatum]|uniref:Uncharacterized protein n=1 Tax=Diphasiastrum complanatum TaxID=34168 RepID=A0ACC2AU38_DIPCM|nr:hypothetical protein O6H91_Y468900 [Diphasiastrum complanatum]KAJ7521028.1 hypothetical protein O6H91_19G034700 [Diphasiastrum complanatum]
MAEPPWTERMKDPPSKFPALPSNLTSGGNLFELLQGRFDTTLPSSFSSSENSLSPYKLDINSTAVVEGTAVDNSDELTHLGLHPYWQQSTHGADELGSSIQGYNGSPTVQLPHGGSQSSYKHDTTAQLQALRDFMTYGNISQENFCNLQSAQQPSMDLNTNSKLHLQLGEGLSTASVSHLRSLLYDSSVAHSKDDFLAYRTLCQAELFGTERTPQRTQFQRENHILAERQRREEMNEKFTALRSMIPKSLKKDKASIVGDTINYIIELEKTLKDLQACKAGRQRGQKQIEKNHPFLDESATISKKLSRSADESFQKFSNVVREESGVTSSEHFKETAGKRPAVEVEVHILGEQAVIKVICGRSPGLVLRILTALEDCKAEVFQSNVTTLGDIVLHFLTVELHPGVSAGTEVLIASLEQAASCSSHCN